MTELRDDDNETLFVGNLDFKVTEEILYELFLQAGPIKSVTIPKDRSTKKPRSFGFVCFKDEVSMPYAYYLFKDLPLFGKPLKIQPRNKRYNIPPVNCVGVHSLEPNIGKKVESQETNISDPPAQEQFTPYSPQQNLLNVIGQNLNTSFPVGLIQPYWMPGYSCNNVNGPPAVDTNAMNNFKNMFENSPYQQKSNKYNHESNQSANFSPNFNSQFNNSGHTFNDSYDRSYSSGRFSNDIHSSPRLSGRLDFSNNERNSHSPFNNRNSTPKYNSNNNHQGHANSPHHDSYSRHNNSSRSNYNSPHHDSFSRHNNSSQSNYNSPYNYQISTNPNSPLYKTNFNNGQNNSPRNNRDRSHFRGERDSYGNDRYNSRHSGGGGGGRNQRY